MALFGRTSTTPSTLVPFELWGTGWVEVAGEEHHARDMAQLLPQVLPERGVNLDLQAELVPEPNNKHDRNAVKVMVGAAHVGYLPREEAARYTPVLTGLVRAGLAPQCPAQLRAWPDYTLDYVGDRMIQRPSPPRCSIVLRLAAPHLIVPLNAPPSGSYALLPPGSAVQVTGEEAYLTALAPWTRPEGEGWVHVTLHEVTEQLARTTRQVVEVRLDGAPVGRLTPKSSGEYIPVLQLLAASDTTVAARALVKGNRLKADVVLYASKAGELDEQWVADATAGTTSALDIRSVSPAQRATSVQPSAAEADGAPESAGLAGADLVTARGAGGWPPPIPGPAWFDNPDGSGDLRWWDGTAWTDHRHPKSGQ